MNALSEVAAAGNLKLSISASTSSLVYTRRFGITGLAQAKNVSYDASEELSGKGDINRRLHHYNTLGQLHLLRLLCYLIPQRASLAIALDLLVRNPRKTVSSQPHSGNLAILERVLIHHVQCSSAQGIGDNCDVLQLLRDPHDVIIVNPDSLAVKPGLLGGVVVILQRRREVVEGGG
nr:hypothetical protein Iba_chr10cCG12580 [Ipomoea batatas]